MFFDICNTIFLYGAITHWCGIAPPDPTIHPEQGTILSSTCSGTTLIEQIADGQGGSIESLTGNSQQCIPEDPEEGTLLREGCSKDYPGVKWFQYADGAGGTYSEKDNKSVECGWSPPVLSLSLIKEFGDAFKPVVVKVDYTNFKGEPEPWGMKHSSSTIGNAIRVDRDTVEIYGDGQLGNGIFTLGNQEIQFFIEEEPVCLVDGNVDCMGYRQLGHQDLIYYGEEDEQIVVWELAILLYHSHSQHGDDITVGLYDRYTRDSDEWIKWQERIDKYNETYEKSGVHIRFELKRLQQAHWHNSANIGSIMFNQDVDIALGHGWSPQGTCGVARVKRYFREGQPPGSISKCGIYTDLHEIGHSVGLAHGPENQANEAVGYIFPEFGHGYNNICRHYDDIMSYGNHNMFHSNSLKSCAEVIVPSSDLSAGGRLWSDTAYALNRVRFTVSLIHNEHKSLEQTNSQYKKPRQLLDDDIIVVD